MLKSTFFKKNLHLAKKNKYRNKNIYKNTHNKYVFFVNFTKV